MLTKLKRRSARCSVNNEPVLPRVRTFKGLILGGVLLIVALGGAFIARLVSPSPPASAHRQARPIVQIVRQQPGLPDIADLIDRLCPSAAMIVPHSSALPPDPNGTPGVPASEYSSDGWLVTSASGLPQGQLDAVFGDGRRADLTEVRPDPVSGLAIVKAADATPSPLPFSDQAFPRVGQFGFALTTPAGTGCSASTAMIGSDFLADGVGLVGYSRLRPAPDGWSAGTPLLSSDGHVLGIGIDDPAGAIIPAPIAAAILDELIRNSPSPSTSFGLRVVDYAGPVSARLGNVRGGAGVAIVQPKSAAAKAGLQAGDIVVAVNDIPVSSASELNRTLDAISGKATLTVQRRSQQLTIAIKRSAGS
jgi:serine protease Do